jgi:hypothetical protein
MKPAPFRLVTLMEILETSAEAWWRLSSMLGQFFIRLEDPQIGFETMEAGIATLAELQREIERLKLDSSLKQLGRIKDALFGNDRQRVTLAQVRPLLTDLHQRMCDDLDGRFFLFLPSEAVPFYAPKEPLFSAQVEAKFPTMSEDIAEAGKCLALNRSTAAVFHLMRVVEIAVQLFGDKLGITLAADKNWQNILDEINKAIKKLDQKAPQTRAYAEASAHLYNVKLCWRNAVMHPKQTYTADEAEALFTAVKIFIRDLAEIL